ncbi:hypothetical protein [Desulfoscipio gibsoniae]
MTEGEKMKYKLRTVGKDEIALFFSGDYDIRIGCIGHFRCDFGHQGKEFWHSWFDHVAEFKTPVFKEEFQSLIDELRANGPLKDLDAMAEWCHNHGDARLGDQYHGDVYGFKAETEAHSYYIRCFPRQGDYNAYIYCYDKRQQ